MKFKIKEENSKRESRRRQRRIVSKMVSVSKAYIVVMWDGRDPCPTAVFDIAALKGSETICAKTMGKITEFVTAAMQYCSEKVKMTDAQARQAD